MYSLFYFDTEDSISPPEAGNDDIVLWIADVLTRHGITGSFHVIGDKARLLEQRGRRDVIDAVKRHDASSHYNHGSIHPTTTEAVAPCGWDDGVQLALDRERPGFADIERIFGKCAGLTRHGGNYAPQTVHAAGRCGKVFYGMPFQLPGHRAFWFAGTLCFSILGLIVTNDGEPGNIEPVYANDQAFEAKVGRFMPLLTETIKREPFTALFGAHPLRMNTTEFACFNHYGGINKPNPQPPPLRPEHERLTIYRNFERFVQMISQVKGLNILGLSGLAQVFGRAPTRIESRDLDDYAQRVCDGDDVPLHERFSPAELLVALAGSGESVMPVIGPTQAASDAPLMGISRAQLSLLASRLLVHLQRTGCLPHDMNCSALLDILCQARLDGGTGPWSSRPRSLYPRVADVWRPQIQDMAKWRVFGPDLDLSRIIDLSCWQAWSAKPAHPLHMQE